MKKINNTTVFITLIAILLTACTAQLASPVPQVTPIPPAPEPIWLSILYPERGQIVLLREYNQELGFDTKSSICVEISADLLLEAGDYWEADDVVERTVVLVDRVQRYQKGQIRNYIVGHFFDDRDVGGPYAFCMSAPVGVGIHRVDISFKKSSGMTPTFSWSFEVVKSSIPTSTPLPTPALTDQQGNLPPYLRAVYPRPGQIVSLEKYVDIAPEDENIWKSDLQNNKAICIAFKTDKLEDLGSLPRDDDDWPSRIYVKVDENLRENWLNPYGSYFIFWENKEPLQTHCMPGELTPGYHSVTLYIDPYDKDLFIYSWGFTITK